MVVFKSMRIFNAQVPPHLKDANQVRAWCEMEEIHFASLMDDKSRSRAPSNQSSLKFRERTASSCSISSVDSNVSMDYMNMNLNRRNSFSSSSLHGSFASAVSFAPSTRTLGGGVRNLQMKVVSTVRATFQKTNSGINGHIPDNLSSLSAIIQANDNAVLRMIMNEIQLKGQFAAF
jgi:hypothetical protein